MDRIEECINEYREWSKKLDIATISDINRVIDEGKTNWLINVSEAWHEQKISEIAYSIKNHPEKRIVLISGPSSSGKTTFANRLKIHLRVVGIKAVTISLDDYYIPIDDMPLNDEGKPDYEALESIDYERFNEDAEKLINGEEALLPMFDFNAGVKVKDGRRMILGDDEVIIVEGIHALNEKLISNIPGVNKHKVYCSALTALRMDDGTRIKSRTNRFIRRLIRDYYFRNSSYSFTFELWPGVEAGSEKNVFPYTDSADVVFNSSLLYELCVYKEHINKIFENVDNSDKNYTEIAELIDLVNQFHSIDADLTPRTSLVREFVGGSTVTE